VIILILPLVIFSTLNPVLELNNVTSGMIQIELVANINSQTNYNFGIFENVNLVLNTLSDNEVKIFL